MTGNKFSVNSTLYASKTSKLQITAIDNKAGLENISYSVNGGDFIKYEGPIIIKNFKDKVIKINYHAVDKIGNSSKNMSTDNEQSYKIAQMDLTGPKLTYSLSGDVFKNRDTIFISDRTLINLKAVDNESGVNHIRYRIGSNTENIFEEAFSLSNFGINKLYYIGEDNVGNINIDSAVLFVDNVPPKIDFHFSSPEYDGSNNNEVYPSNVKLFTSATDMNSGLKNIKYSYNGKDYYLYKTSIKSFDKNKTYSLIFKAEDMLGNFEKNEIIFKIAD